MRVNSNCRGSSPRWVNWRTHSSMESPIASMRCTGVVAGVYTSYATYLPARANRSSRVNLSGVRPIACWGSLAMEVDMANRDTPVYLKLLQLFNQRVQAFLAVEIGETLLFGRRRERAQQPCVVERGTIGHPDFAVRIFHLAHEAGHAFNSYRLTAAAREAHGGLRQHLPGG